MKTNDHFTEVDLEAIPISDPVSGLRYFVVLFVDREETPTAPAKLISPEEESEQVREVGRLSQDLASTRAFLQSVIEQKESANEELRAANEEVISANEELQSTNEELTTAKEELQATNEELSTVNDELQSRIRTANQLADDVVNLIEMTRIPIVVLGPDLCIRRFTPAAQVLMSLRPSDVGRPFSDLKSKLNIPDLGALVRQVIDTLEIKQLEVSDESGAWHKLYIRPYKTLEHKIGGVVLMLIDINALKRREQEIQESRDFAVSIVETVREPLLVLNGELRVETANRAFYESFRVEPADTLGRLVYELGDGQWDIPELKILLEEMLPQNAHFVNFEVEHAFPSIGQRAMLLNAHCLGQGAAKAEQVILLAIEDVTAQKRSERLREESESRLRHIIDTAVDAIITIDEHGAVSSINAATERMFGYPAGELIGQNISLLMPSPYRNEHDGYLTRYLQTGQKHIIGIGREVQGPPQGRLGLPARSGGQRIRKPGAAHVYRRITRPQRAQGPRARSAGSGDHGTTAHRTGTARHDRSGVDRPGAAGRQAGGGRQAAGARRVKHHRQDRGRAQTRARTGAGDFAGTRPRGGGRGRIDGGLAGTGCADF